MKLFIGLLTAVLLASSVVCADSLWQPEYHRRGSLYSDDKAFDIGDIVTIVISETISAKRKSKTTTSKDVSNTGSITSWFYPKNPPEYLEKDNEMPSWEYKVDKGFTGQGEIQEDDTFSAKITARVIDVLPNGNLLIQGSREISVANDRKRIILSGIVRRNDITAANTVESNLIADAKIYYDGKGPISDNQRRGVFTWLRDMFALF